MCKMRKPEIAWIRKVICALLLGILLTAVPAFADNYTVEAEGTYGQTAARGMLANPRLLADLASALRGESPPEFTLQEKAALLGEFVVHSPRHFQLQMAANLYGKDTPEFRAFLRK